jgi:ComF family protein
MMKTARIFQTIEGVGALLADQLYPPRCTTCYVSVSSHGNLCQYCYGKLHVISDPQCAVCGIPFSLPQEIDSQCARCLVEPPLFHQARSVWVYNAISARMIKTLKFEDRAPMLKQFIVLMARAGGTILPDADYLIPVPMHWKSLLIRRYNPAVWLADALAQKTGVTCRGNLLARSRASKPQRGLKRAERLKNLRKAFYVPAKMRPLLQGKKLVLIDDVITTGATANACTDALLKAGAARVDVVTLAHTVLEGT